MWLRYLTASLAVPYTIYLLFWHYLTHEPISFVSVIVLCIFWAILLRLIFNSKHDGCKSD